MKQNPFQKKKSSWIFFSLITCVIFLNACKKNSPTDHPLRHFTQKNLVDNNHGYGALHTDSTLINAWGIAFNPTGVPWVNAQGGHVSEIYDKEGTILRPPVWIPGPAKNVPGNPSGIVFNATNDFVLSDGASAKFLFVGVDGVFSGWNPGAGDTALTIANNTATSAYTGLAIATSGGNNYLYAADFRAGKIVVWDKSFSAVSWTFTDPSLPGGYSPYNIQAIGEWLYVTYAKPGPDGHEQFGEGFGVVNIFKTNGDFVKRFTANGALNAPWGVTSASPGFFKDNDDDSLAKAAIAQSGANMILVGNFGDGKINAYTADGKYVGALKSRGQPIVISGLWRSLFLPLLLQLSILTGCISHQGLTMNPMVYSDM
ncbi:MAG: TIGR03118 family protein [Chitinophagaceae bacterium]|nr:TIGR03118 family protein [Chitinophagaceae bacterium]